jgi:hypothetical protein
LADGFVASPRRAETAVEQVPIENAGTAVKEMKVDRPKLNFKPKFIPGSRDQPQIPNPKEALSIGPSAISRPKGKQPQAITIQQPTPPRPIAKIPSHHEIIEIPDSSPSPPSSASSPINSASISPTNLPSAETILALIDARNADDAVVRELAGIYRRQRAAEDAVAAVDDVAERGEAEQMPHGVEQEVATGPGSVESAVTSQDPIGGAAGIGGAASVKTHEDVQSEGRTEVSGVIAYVSSAVNSPKTN